MILRSLFYLTLLLALPVWGITPSPIEQAARALLAKRIPHGRLLWVRNEQIYYSTLNDWRPRRITTERHKENRPRWSPDGSRIVFERDGDGVYLMDADFSHKKTVLAGAHTADWSGDGDAITAISADGYRVLRYELAGGKVSTLYDSRLPPYNGQRISQAAELRMGGRYLLTFRRTPKHTSEVVDLLRRRYLANKEMKRGDCKPAWAGDGGYIVTTARTGNRPALIAAFDGKRGAIGPSKRLIGLNQGLRYYVHDARVSNDGNWLVFAGKVLLGPTMVGRREIYIWRVGEPENMAVRLTFNTGEDDKPSLYIPGARTFPTPAPQ